MADRSVKVYLKGDISDFNRAMLSASAGAKAFAGSLDTSTDRMTNLVQTSLALGPALVPIGALAVPAITGLTNQLAFATAGAGVAAIAFQGVGDALKATNDYALEPSTANFEKLQESLRTLGPAGQNFVAFLQEMRPEMQRLQDAAQAGLFPGVQDGLSDLMRLMPEAERIITHVATALGDLVSEAGFNLAGSDWQEFFTFLENEARPTLLDMGRTFGNFTRGFAELWMAFDPLSDQFSKSFLQMSRDFAEWADGLDQTEGFQEFVDYIQQNGPKAWDALSSLGNALVQIVEAAAPVGAAVLPAISALADAFAAVADSDIGPVLIGAAAGLSAFSRAMMLLETTQTSKLGGLFGKSAFGGAAKAAKDLPAATGAMLRFDAAAARASMSAEQFSKANSRLSTSMKGAGKLAAGAGGLAFVMSDLDEKMGLSNTAMLGMAGALAGPWGLAIGAGVGLAMDFAAANDDIGDAVDRANEAVGNTSLDLNQKIAAIDASLETLSQKRKKIINDMSEVGGLGGAADTSEVDEASKKLRDTRKELTQAAQEQKFAEAGLAAEMDGASQSTRDQVEATLDLIGVHNELSDILLGERGGMRGLEQAIDDASAAAKKNGRTLDINTQAGRDNQEQLDRIAEKYNGLSVSQRANEGVTRRSRKAYIDAAVSMGMSRTAARKLADAIFKIPDQTEIDIKDNADAARRRLMALQGFIDGMHGKTVKIHIEGGTPGGQLVNAEGSITDYFAQGGFSERHVAQIAPAGVTRVWNEPETGGEAYIPLALSKRERSLDIWAQTGRRLGVPGFADGALVRPMSGGGSVSVAAPEVNVTGGMTEAQFERVAVRVLSRGVRIVGKPGNQRLEIMGG